MSRTRTTPAVLPVAAALLLSACSSSADIEADQQAKSSNASATQALTVDTSFINVATDLVKGIDFVLDYNRRLGPGRLDFGAEAVRTLKRINQTDLGQATGLSQTQLSRRLLGRIPFTVDELDRIAGVLGIELTELIAPTP